MQTAHGAVVDAVNDVAEKENLVLRRNAESKLTIWSFTPRANWLDVVEIEFAAASDNHSGSPTHRRAADSGFPSIA